jgi:hypothetical protein
MAKGNMVNTTTPNGTKKRKGMHAKKKTSNIKTSKLYKKKYKGQGR